MGPCSVSTRSQSKPTDAISSATSGSPKFRRLPKDAFPARNRCFTWLGVIGRQYSAGENPVGGLSAPPLPAPPLEGVGRASTRSPVPSNPLERDKNIRQDRATVPPFG